MLWLTRTPQKRIRIGDTIEIVVGRISGDQVKIGIIAPKDVKVLRSELRERDKAEAKKKGISHKPLIIQKKRRRIISEAIRIIETHE